MLVLMAASAEAQTVRRGDANNDKKVDSKDVTEVSNAIMGEPSVNYNKDNADANKDGKVNAADIVAIINMLENDSGNPVLLLWRKDGQIAKFGFTEKPVITYSGSDLVLTTTKTIVQYPIYMLKKIVFDVENIADDIENLEVRSESLFSFKNETLFIRGGEPNSPVYLYDLKGVKVDESRLDPDGRAIIPLQHLGKSIYIVKNKGISFKFRKS
jgi:hypothetical protein